MPHLLVVEDDTNQRELYGQEFSDEGYQVTLTANGSEALNFLASSKPDLVVLDICMPGMDGMELLSHILAKDRLIPVVLNTAYSQYRENYLSWPANAYVVKSGDLTELKGKVRELLEIFKRQPSAV